MTSCAEFLEQPDAEEHVVQLYGTDDQLLTRNVGRYLVEGLRRGDGLLVIATPEHRTTLARHLREERAYSRAVLQGGLVFLDARTTLDRFMVDGQPNQGRFESVIGEVLRGVQARADHTGVRAFGEMVGILWQAGQFSAAIRLEELWNTLLQSKDVSLFCAYPIDIFSEEFQVGKVDALLCAHTHLMPVDSALESALETAMNEVLGRRVAELKRLIKANHRPSWGTIPPAEGVVLWLRNNLPGSVGEILHRARQYYQPLASSRH